LDRTDPLLISALARIAERDGRTEELLAALSAEAEHLGPEGAVSHLAISRVHDRAGRHEEALTALKAARALKPQEPLVLAELAAIYQAQGQNDLLADVLLSWLSSIQDDTDLVSLNLRLGALYEELGKDTDAVARYEAILARDGKNTTALAGLGKLYHRTQDWDGLLAIYDREIAASDDPRQRAGRLFRSAELLEQRLNRVDDAIARHRQALQILPGYLPAQKSLTRILEKLARHSDLVAMYEQELQHTTDRDQSVTLLHRMASVHEEKLGDLDGAIDCLQRAMKLAPDHQQTLQSLEQLFEQAGRWRDLLGAIEQEAALAPDTKQVLALRHRVAEILEGPLQDLDGATRAYERLLALSPSYLPALKALGTLYARRGAWSELIAMYRAESETSPTEHAATLTFKIGELYEQKLTDENQAVAAYQEVLTLAPSYFPALRALARIYRRQQAWESLVDVLRAEAANRTDPGERANALFQAACIWEDRLARKDLATSVYQEVLRLAPAHGPALRALERLLTAGDDLKERVAILDREVQSAGEPALRNAAALKLARLYLDKLHEPGRAAQCCETVLANDPSNLWALKLLERIRAKDPVKSAEVKARISERTVEQRLRTSLRVAAALDAEPGSAHAALVLKEAFAEEPSTGRVAYALERAIRPTGDAKALAALYEIQVDHAENPDEKIHLMMRIAELAETRLSDFSRALGWYEKVLEVRPDYLPAQQGIRRVAIRRNDWTAARHALEAEVLIALDDTTRLDSHLQLADVSLQLNDDDAAIHHYREALTLNPMHASATEGLERLLVRRGGAPDLARLHEQRAESHAAGRNSSAASDEWTAAAKFWRTAGHPLPAQLALGHALAAVPTHPEALEVKAELAQSLEQWSEAAAALALRVQQGGDPQALTQFHLTLGRIYQEHLADQTRAIAYLQTVLGRDPGNTKALERLATLQVTGRNWSSAQEALQQLCGLPLEPDRLARHYASLGRVLEEGGGDPHAAIAAYQRSFELNPGDDTLVERLTVLHERTGTLEAWVNVLKGALTSARDLDSTLRRRLQLGQLHQRLNQLTEAITVYEAAVASAPASIPARVALADLYVSSGNNAQAISAHRQLLGMDPTRVESLRTLYKLWTDQKDIERAFVVAGILVALRESTPDQAAFHQEHRGRLGQEPKQAMTAAQLEQLLHPAAKGPALEVLRLLGPWMHKLYPDSLEKLRIDRKADRLKSDNPLSKALGHILIAFGHLDPIVYQSRRNVVAHEMEESLSFSIGQDVAKRYHVREQRFLFGRAGFDATFGTTVVHKLSTGELTELLGATVRVVLPDFARLGRKNEALTKQLRKILPRKTLKALETPCRELAALPQDPDIAKLFQALGHSANRAGTVASGDAAAALSVLFKDVAPTATALASNEATMSSHLGRADLHELVGFNLSDTYFDLRKHLGA
jgi:cellulose synthase operon protein C